MNDDFNFASDILLPLIIGGIGYLSVQIFTRLFWDELDEFKEIRKEIHEKLIDHRPLGSLFVDTWPSDVNRDQDFSRMATSLDSFQGRASPLTALYLKVFGYNIDFAVDSMMSLLSTDRTAYFGARDRQNIEKCLRFPVTVSNEELERQRLESLEASKQGERK